MAAALKALNASSAAAVSALGALQAAADPAGGLKEAAGIVGEMADMLKGEAQGPASANGEWLAGAATAVAAVARALEDAAPLAPATASAPLLRAADVVALGAGGIRASAWRGAEGGRGALAAAGAALATARGALEGAEKAARCPDEEAEALARIRREAVMAGASRK